ncbi:MAG: zinc-ribbon domain-containing protein, partial [Oscillospiraceae bacterium]|nr:zinc-ribbon domain-containing protein [Oscillospiraceae bacterium]
MLYCPECGAVLSDGAKFCYRCKARIAAPIGNGVTPVVKRPEEESISPAAVPVPEEETAHIIDTILEEVPEVIAEPDDETGICADEAAVAEDIVIPEESFAAEALAEDEVLQVTEDLVSAEEPFAEGGDAEADTEPEREDIISSEEPYAEDEDAEADTAPEVEDIASPEEPYTEEEQAETDAEPEEEDIDPSEEAFAEEHTETDAEADAEAEAVSEETCPEEDTDTEPESEDTASETVVSETVPAPEENTERELLNMLEELRPSAHREEQAEPYDLFAALRDIPSFFETESIPVLTG